MGSFFSLHYRFNLFFRFPLLRRVFFFFSPSPLHLYRDMKRSERIAEQQRRLREDSILGQRGSMGIQRWESTTLASMGKCLHYLKNSPGVGRGGPAVFEWIAAILRFRQRGVNALFVDVPRLRLSCAPHIFFKMSRYSAQITQPRFLFLKIFNQAQVLRLGNFPPFKVT